MTLFWLQPLIFFLYKSIWAPEAVCSVCLDNIMVAPWLARKMKNSRHTKSQQPLASASQWWRCLQDFCKLGCLMSSTLHTYTSHNTKHISFKNHNPKRLTSSPLPSPPCSLASLDPLPAGHLLASSIDRHNGSTCPPGTSTEYLYL